jgi:kinesin family member 15
LHNISLSYIPCFALLLQVCNLKEEVRIYKLHKQSEAEYQAVDDTLCIDNASECDVHEELCQEKFHLKK